MARTVAIGYVSGGNVCDSFLRSCLGLMLYDRDRGDVIDGVAHSHGLYVDQNRNRMVRKFLQGGCPWLFSLDTDTVFEPDVLYRLMELAHQTDAKIVSAMQIGFIQVWKGRPLEQRPIWFDKRPDGGFQVVGNLKNEPQELAAIGMGCCLIHRDVFQAFPNQDQVRAWFTCADRNVSGEWDFYGEDMIFCDCARALGFKIMGDSRIRVGHDKGGITLTVETMLQEMRSKGVM